MATISKTLKPGQVLFSEGQSPASIFIIQKGAVSIRKSKGREFVEMAKLQTGEIIGELSFFDKLPRSATAVALIETEVLEIPFESLDKIYNSMPTYMKTIVASLAERLRNANEQLRILQKTHAPDPTPEIL